MPSVCVREGGKEGKVGERGVDVSRLHLVCVSEQNVVCCLIVYTSDIFYLG
jgi:hypothetical protein